MKARDGRRLTVGLRGLMEGCVRGGDEQASENIAFNLLQKKRREEEEEKKTKKEREMEFRTRGGGY